MVTLPARLTVLFHEICDYVVKTWRPCDDRMLYDDRTLCEWINLNTQQERSGQISDYTSVDYATPYVPLCESAPKIFRRFENPFFMFFFKYI